MACVRRSVVKHGSKRVGLNLSVSGKRKAEVGGAVEFVRRKNVKCN